MCHRKILTLKINKYMSLIKYRLEVVIDSALNVGRIQNIVDNEGNTIARADIKFLCDVDQD